jgi:RHS repeat-associated protein
VGLVEKTASGVITLQVQYVYDAFNRRIAKVVDPDGAGAQAATTERYVYEGDDIALVFDGSGNQIHRYLNAPGIDAVLAQESSTGTIWALSDHQGTVRDLVDNSGTKVNHISYDSFGNITAQTNPIAYFRFSYTGQEFDRETGNYYYWNRYYDPGTGRFLSQDPLGFGAGDVNLYRYVGNSPTNFTDPTGEFAWVPLILLGIGIPVVSDMLYPRIVQAPMHWCDNVPEIDRSNEKAIAETLMGLGAGSGPGLARGLGSLADDAIKGLPRLWRTPGADLVPVEGFLPALDDLARGGSSWGKAGVSPAGQVGAGNGLGSLAEPFFSKGGDLNWSPKSVETFGHTFNQHGAGSKNTRNLTGRAGGTGREQGQWTDNKGAADFLRLKSDEVSGPASVQIPEGLGQVIMPDGTIVPAKWATIVPRSGGGYTTAYPILSP